jgi:hypothetical protein
VIHPFHAGLILRTQLDPYPLFSVAITPTSVGIDALRRIPP